MFGIKKKVYDIIALVFSASGIILLALNIFNAFGDDKQNHMIINLGSIVLLLLAFAIYLRPKTKLMQIEQKYQSEYRSELYTLITKGSSRNKLDVRKVTLKENEDHHLEVLSNKTNDKIIISDLSFNEGLYIIMKLLEEFSDVMYGEVDNNSKKGKYKKPTKATIDEFEVELIYLNGEIKTRKLIEDYKYI